MYVSKQLFYNTIACALRCVKVHTPEGEEDDAVGMRINTSEEVPEKALAYRWTE